MKIVENSSNRLRLSNDNGFWEKWIFVGAIVIVLLSGIFVSGWVIRPVCWSGVVGCCFVLFLLIREIPRNFDMEFLFDNEEDQLKVFKHPWLGRPQCERYPLGDILSVRVFEPVRRYSNVGNDYVDYYEHENQPQIESHDYSVELNMRSGNPLHVVGGEIKNEAAQLAAAIEEFLGLGFTSTG
jgi:hypothetical protein